MIVLDDITRYIFFSVYNNILFGRENLTQKYIRLIQEISLFNSYWNFELLVIFSIL